MEANRDIWAVNTVADGQQVLVERGQIGWLEDAYKGRNSLSSSISSVRIAILVVSIWSLALAGSWTIGPDQVNIDHNPSAYMEEKFDQQCQGTIKTNLRTLGASCDSGKKHFVTAQSIEPSAVSMCS